MPSLMKKLLRPAVILMNRLPYPRKMGLVALVFSLALASFLYLLVSEINVVIDFGSKEILGSKYNRTLTILLQDIQQHRGYSILRRKPLLSYCQACSGPLYKR